MTKNHKWDYSIEPSASYKNGYKIMIPNQVHYRQYTVWAEREGRGLMRVYIGTRDACEAYVSRQK